MSWNDTVKAAALAAQAEHTATAARVSVDTPWSWNPHAVWLTRIQPPHDLTAQPSKNGPITQPRQDITARRQIPRS